MPLEHIISMTISDLFNAINFPPVGWSLPIKRSEHMNLTTVLSYQPVSVGATRTKSYLCTPRRDASRTSNPTVSRDSKSDDIIMSQA